MATNNEILDLLRSTGNRIPYQNLNNIDVIKDISITYIDLNIIIGIRGRENFLPVCIRYFKKALENSPISVKITIVEQDTLPHFRDTCKDLDLDYVFIPNNFLSSGKAYNRSFCFNVGYLLANPSTWFMFHDIDILIDPEFFTKLKTYLDKNPSWLQPYTKKRVLLLKPDITNTLLKHQFCVDFSVFKEERDYRPATPGSTGGSILVRNDIFAKVGGFDPELFYGYGPEDSFFWSKLECLDKRIDVVFDHFAGGGMFANDPMIDVYHMYHKSMSGTNSDEKVMLGMRKYFWQIRYEEKMKIVQEKERILQEATTLLKQASLKF